MHRWSKPPILVGLSGGVDSAVAALLLKRAGHAVESLFMSVWEDDDDAYCTSSRDFQDARAVADELGIPLHRVSFAAQYRERVFAYFLAEHRAARTPNPDVLCNREIKFGLGLAYARRLGGVRLATGHYARLIDGAEGPQLHKALDGAKDQSYFLHAVARADLAQACFPLGELPKPQVRALARAAGLPVHDKPDSTGICFIGERPFREFLARYLREEPGPIESDAGERLGSHRGLAFYTLGQRAGLALGGRAGHEHAPWYVAAKHPARNALIVVQGQEHPLLVSRALTTGAVNWLCEPPAAPFAAHTKLRYRQSDIDVRVLPRADATLRLEFSTLERAVTPGQFAVLYAGTQCLGGAVIEHSESLGSQTFSPYNLPAISAAGALRA
ncbi:MAG TPA: tRNA 2-thiouridine(34) synthase MnmA [Steroidobacteraceae bacterium]